MKALYYIMEKENGRGTYLIFVNKKQFKVTEKALSGAQILDLDSKSPNEYSLFLVEGQKSQQIEPSQSVEIKDGLHFNAIITKAPYG